MSKRRKVLLVLAAGVMALFAFLLLGWRHGSEDLAARQKLDNLLGQADEQPLPPVSPFIPDERPAPLASAPPPEPPGFLGLPIPNPMSMSGIPDSGVEVQESPTGYVLRIPLTNPAEARNVKVNVSANHIEVSGKIGRQEQGVSFTSSFVQSFSTSQPVLPNKVTQKTEKNGAKTELVIRIPKQSTGSSNIAPQPPPAPQAPAAPQAPQENMPDDPGTGQRVI
jgi:hypothetical protein